MVWDGTQAGCGGWRLAVGVRCLWLLVRQARYCGLAMCAWIEETTLAACSAVPWVKASVATSVALALCKNHHLCRVTNVVTCRSLLHARRPASQLMARRDRWPPVAASGAAGKCSAVDQMVRRLVGNKVGICIIATYTAQKEETPTLCLSVHRLFVICYWDQPPTRAGRRSLLFQLTNTRLPAIMTLPRLSCCC
jgi:hypothetical protein